MGLATISYSIYHITIQEWSAIEGSSMHQYINCFIKLCLTLLLTNAFAHRLTPPDEPRNDSFYVCYKHSRTQTIIHAPLANYKDIHYMGCMIDTRPCASILIKHSKKCTQTVRITHLVPCANQASKITNQPCKACVKHSKVKLCPTVIVKQQACPAQCFKQFGWFNNYPQALNAFYRCAYS